MFPLGCTKVVLTEVITTNYFRGSLLSKTCCCFTSTPMEDGKNLFHALISGMAKSHLLYGPAFLMFPKSKPGPILLNRGLIVPTRTPTGLLVMDKFLFKIPASRYCHAHCLSALVSIQST